MRVRSIELYLLPSLTEVLGGEPLVLIDAPGRRAFLAKDGGEARIHVARRAACGVMLASSLMGSTPGRSPRERFDEVASSPGARLAPMGDGILLVIDCEADEPDRDPQNVIDLGEFAISVGPSDSPLREAVVSARNTALAALSLSAFRGVTDDGRSLGSVDMIYHVEDQRPFYVVEVKGGFTMTSKSALLPEQAAEAVQLSSALDGAAKGLRHVPRLLAQSDGQRLNPLNSFISAWAGLEILIVSSFSGYESMFSTALNEALSPAAAGVAERMRDVMKDKYRLADKFSIMASVLDPEMADEDVEAFNNLKKVRDVFFHTLTSSPADLPADATRQMLRKFLRLHLRNM
ncbi:hypothetical protein [Sphingomonas sp. PAMC 26617]|uniref:hypothetical protein n=1 Tax=Sphingomonas sp. PAMC 26617 TaxID=1112216 RepID=UPI0002885315|nr:hypothetical protein [Sphingomonas sp. PAMC 26617]